jgi:hypothetical protein
MRSGLFLTETKIEGSSLALLRLPAGILWVRGFAGTASVTANPC